MKIITLPLVNFALIFTLFSQTNTFPASGSVGIGTTSPSEKLHMQTTGGPASFLLERTDGMSFKAIGGLYGAGFFYSQNGYLTFSPNDFTNNTPDWNNSFTVYGSTSTYPGQIVIGQQFPGDDSKFSVNGRVLSEEVKVVTDIAAPDYVFKEDYYLRSLDEVKSFIDQNGHLPEIPSAKEFEEKGLFLGQMSFDLLKKIEELTLYTIDLKEENKGLLKRIEALENK